MGGGAADHRGEPSATVVILRQDLSGVTLGRYEGHNTRRCFLPMTPSCSFETVLGSRGIGILNALFGHEA